MAGLLDLFSGDDPQQQGLLSAAAQMLQASGPSLMPHSFGQVMGAGLGGFQQGQAQAQALQQAKLKMMLEQAQVAQALRQGAALQPAYDRIGQHFAGAQAPAAGSTPAGAGGLAPGSAPAMASPAPTSAAPQVAPGAQQQPAAGMFGLSDDALMGGVLAGPGELGKAIIAANAPTDFTKLLKQAGIDPNSTLGRQIMQQQIAKQNNIPLQAGRAGAPMYNPDGSIAAMAPIIPKNAVPQIVGGKVVGVSPLAGASGVEQINAYADQAGKNQAEPISGFDASGNPVFTNKLSAATGGGAWTGGTLSTGAVQALQQGAAAGNPDAKAALAAYQQAQAQRVAPALAPGVEKSIGGNVDTMNNDFGDLFAANKQAPVTLALLDNIKKLAPAAITGSSSDKLAYVNGLLTLGGFQKQKDLATATDLLNKNANMLAINMRLGANGGGSDSLQALAQAANPNSHMQPDAIAKAADEVAGQVRMRQAMYQKLLPYKMNNDTQGYYATQQQFASQADPRAYQPGAQPQATAPAPAAPAPQKFNMLPPAAQFDGKRMQADNGTIYRSVGGKWVKE